MTQKPDDRDAKIERLQSAIAWTKQVRPGKTREGGAVVEMSWDEFNTMRALADDEASKMTQRHAREASTECCRGLAPEWECRCAQDEAGK